MEVVKMIIDTMVDSETLKPNSMGLKLYEVAKEVETKRKQTKEPEKKAELTEAEQKVLVLKKCEMDNDLGWMDYSSWNVFNPIFRKTFLEIVDPLFWGGLYFQYSKFEFAMSTLAKYLTLDCSISVLRDGKNFQLVVTGTDDYLVSKKKVMEFENYQRMFHSKICKAFCRDTKDGLVVRSYQEGRQQCRK